MVTWPVEEMVQVWIGVFVLLAKLERATLPRTGVPSLYCSVRKIGKFGVPVVL
jgi:hypothetical protein